MNLVLLIISIVLFIGLLFLLFVLKKRNEHVEDLILENEQLRKDLRYHIKWRRATVGGVPPSYFPQRARIIKCESDMWYKDKIGEEIEIASFGTFGMHTVDGQYVIFNDVEFI